MRRAIFLIALAWALVAAPGAYAQFGLKGLDVIFTPEEGHVPLEAGSHPAELTTKLALNTAVIPGGAIDPETGEPVDGEIPEGALKDLEVTQIPGFIGNQRAVPRCSNAQFRTRIEGYPQCPDAAAIGVASLKAEFNVFPVGTEEFIHVPVYNLVPSPGEAAKFGFVALNVPVVLDVSVNPNPPFNLVAHLDDIPQGLLVYGSELTIWGVPASDSHDSLRGECVGEPVKPTPLPVSLGDCPVSTPELAFLTMPRSCQGPQATVFRADSWLQPGAFTDPQQALTHNEALPPEEEGMNNCESLRFTPQADARPTTTAASSPSGLELGLEVSDPGLIAPGGRAQSDIRRVEVTLPEGMTVNPGAADGMVACTKAQYDAASLSDRGCPDAAKLGTLEVESPLLEESLQGSIYLAQPDDPATAEPGAENPFDSLIGFYMLIENERNGIFVKQAGRVEPDPASGRLTSVVEDIPQLPFSRLSVRFREGPRAPLATPARCGSYTSKVMLTPWSGGEAVESNSTFQITGGPEGASCPAGIPFAPGFQAGSVNNAAGVYSPFFIHLIRGSQEEPITRFSSSLPPGVVPKLAGVARCSDQQIAAAAIAPGRVEALSPSCPVASQIGRVLAGAGAGSALTYVPGKVYLSGPFAGSPMSVVAVVPAVAGPFDLGTVVTREGIDINPITYRGEVDGTFSEPIPQMLRGIPLGLRDLRIYVDRPDFMRNPTSCAPAKTTATVFGSAQRALLSARYQAASCASLAFKPRLSLALKGKTKRSGHPELRSVLVPRMGDANIAKAVVTLPHSEFIDQNHISNPCTRVQFNAGNCPAGSVLGTARAITPLLDEPLEGPIYFRSNGGERKLPDVVVDLRGQFHITLVGFVSSSRGRIRTTFAAAPDAPVTKFSLRLKGGREGLLVNSQDLCSKARFVQVRFTGQSGKTTSNRQPIATSCRQGHN